MNVAPVFNHSFWIIRSSRSIDHWVQYIKRSWWPCPPSPYHSFLILVVHWMSSWCFLSPVHHLSSFNSLSFFLFVFLFCSSRVILCLSWHCRAIREVLLRKKCIRSGIALIRGEGRPFPNFLAPFQEVHFYQILVRSLTTLVTNWLTDWLTN